jgi:regulator of replication initiation timing
MTVEDLFKKIGAQTMEIDALRLEIERLAEIIGRQQAEAKEKGEEKKSK